MGTNWSESEEDSKESDVSFKTDWSRRYKIWSSIGVRLESLQSAISRASAKWDDLQGRTAHVKDTPPSPKEKPEDFIGADIDSVADDEDWVDSSYSLMAKGSPDSFDSGVSFKSDWSKDGLIDFKDSSSLKMAKGSMESIDSGVSFKSDWSRSGLINFKDRVSPSRCSPDFSSSEEELAVADDKDLVECPDDLMATTSLGAFGSSLSSMNDSIIRNRQRSLPRMGSEKHGHFWLRFYGVTLPSQVKR